MAPSGFAGKPGFFVPVRVLAKLFRRLILEKLEAANAAGKLQFLGEHRHLGDALPSPPALRRSGQRGGSSTARGPSPDRRQAVLANLARYTHRVAIANSRLLAADAHGVTFTWKDYRFGGRDRYKTTTLETLEFTPPSSTPAQPTTCRTASSRISCAW